MHTCQVRHMPRTRMQVLEPIAHPQIFIFFLIY